MFDPELSGLYWPRVLSVLTTLTDSQWETPFWKFDVKGDVVKAAVRVFLLSPFLFLPPNVSCWQILPVRLSLFSRGIQLRWSSLLTPSTHIRICSLPKETRKRSRERPPLSQIQRVTWQSLNLRRWNSSKKVFSWRLRTRAQSTQGQMLSILSQCKPESGSPECTLALHRSHIQKSFSCCLCRASASWSIESALPDTGCREEQSDVYSGGEWVPATLFSCCSASFQNWQKLAFSFLLKNRTWIKKGSRLSLKAHLECFICVSFDSAPPVFSLEKQRNSDSYFHISRYWLNCRGRNHVKWYFCLTVFPPAVQILTVVQGWFRLHKSEKHHHKRSDWT